MRWIRWTIAALLAVGLPGHALGQKSRYSSSGARADALDYPLTVHVVSSHLEAQPALDSDAHATVVSMLHLNVVIGGEKLELAAGASALLHAGDYRARMVANEEKKSGWFSRSYELLFDDGTHVIFKAVGQSES